MVRRAVWLRRLLYLSRAVEPKLLDSGEERLPCEGPQSRLPLALRFHVLGKLPPRLCGGLARQEANLELAEMEPHQ